METVAVYLESKIKTYGFYLETDLSLLEIKMPPAELGLWGARIEEIGGLEIRFRLVLGRIHENQSLSLYLVVEGTARDRLMNYLAGGSGGKAEAVFPVTSPVELLSFQGPHYGDRPGIAYAALSALSSKGIPVIISGYSVSSIHMVLKEDHGETARDILQQSFEIPRKRHRRPIGVKR